MTSANTLLAVMTSITTMIIKLLKELWADRLMPACPFLNVKCNINKYFTNSTISDYSITEQHIYYTIFSEICKVKLKIFEK